MDLNLWLPSPEQEETATNYRSRSIALLQPGSDAINQMLAERQRAVTQQELEREKAILAQKYREQVEKELVAEKAAWIAEEEKVALLSQLAGCCFVLANCLQADLKTNEVIGSEWQFRVQNGCIEIKNQHGFNLQASRIDFTRSIAKLAKTELQQLTDFSNLLQATVYDRLAKQKNANLEL